MEERIGTWIDGKPIYKKIITLTTSTSACGGENYAESVIDINDLNLATIIRIESYISNNGNWEGNTYYKDMALSIITQIVLIDEKLTLKVRHNQTFVGGGIAYITLLYTKTTD